MAEQVPRQLYSQKSQKNYDPRDLEYERQKEDCTFKPAINKRPWQGARPDSRAGSRAGSGAGSRAGSGAGGRINSGIKGPARPVYQQEQQYYRNRNPDKPLTQMDM